MRPYSVNLKLKRFLTFALLIGIQFQILVSGMLALELSSHEFSTEPSGALFENKTLPMMKSTVASDMLPEGKTIIKQKTIGSKRSLLIPITPTTSTPTPITTPTPKISTISTITTTITKSTAILSPTLTTIPATATTAKDPISTTTVVNKSSSKFSLDFVLSKNHWTKAGEMTEKPKSLQTQTFRNKHHHEHHWGPFFEEPLNPNEGDQMQSAAHLYTEAVLNCRVGMLRDKTVMWVRRTTEKVSLLTVGNVTYSGDPRIRVKFQYPNNWRLLINPTQKEDAGLYMCQVSTHPPRVFATNLTILEPPLRLIDEQEHEVTDRYYKTGSTIDLKCQVSRSFLLKEKRSIVNNNRTKLISTTNELNSTDNNKQMEFDQQFKEIVIWAKDDELMPATTLKRTSTTEKWISSRITIPDARMSDGGNYSCSIAKLFKAIVQVQVLTGELPAAVQHNSSETIKLSRTLSIIFLLSVLIALSQSLKIHQNPSMMDISPLRIFNFNFLFS